MPWDSHLAVSKTIEFITNRGMVHIRSYCPPDFLGSLEFDEGIGVFPGYRSMIRDIQGLVEVARDRNSNVVIAYAGGRIVGYIAFSNPSPLGRWGRGGGGVLYELGAIEVSRGWRLFDIASEMARLALDNDFLEDKIVFYTGFSWHWDLEWSGLSKLQYRKMVVKLFQPHGFKLYYTTEPNINLDFANIFMARIGSRVSEEERERFMEMLLGED